MRIDKAQTEMAFAPKFDFILVNDQLEVALKQAEQAVSEFISK
jgi:guanylate kinase